MCVGVVRYFVGFCDVTPALSTASPIIVYAVF